MNVNCKRCKTPGLANQMNWMAEDGSPTILAGDPYCEGCRLILANERMEKLVGDQGRYVQGIKKNIFELPLSPRGKPCVWRGSIVYGLNGLSTVFRLNLSEAKSWCDEKAKDIDWHFGDATPEENKSEGIYMFMYGRNTVLQICVIALVEVAP